LRQLLPREHGSWAFVLEPVLLGLLAVPSAAGWLVAAAVVAGFLAWQPLLEVGRRDQPQARWIASLLIAAAAVAAAAAARLAGPQWLVAGAAAAPLFLLWASYSLRRRGREWLAELAGPLSLAGAATAIALAGGAESARAWALWAALATRIVPSILYIRARLRGQRSQQASVTPPVAAHVLGFGAMLGLRLARLVPIAGVAVSAALLARALWGLARASRPISVQRIGFAEIGWGLLFVLSIGV
jgi:hypothetical protein